MNEFPDPRVKRMRAYSRIIVENYGGHWGAWFAEAPLMAIGGVCHADAVWRLLKMIGSDEFQIDEISLDVDASAEDHLEFLVPYRRLVRVPTPSIN